MSSLFVVTVDRFVPAPPEAVFALVADPRRHRDIDGSGTVRDATDVPERLVLGAQFGMDMHLGRGYSMVSTVIEFEENRRIAWQSRPPEGSATRKYFGGRIWRYVLTPAPGGTLVSESWDITQEKNRLLVTPYRFATTRNMKATLERIAEIVG